VQEFTESEGEGRKANAKNGNFGCQLLQKELDQPTINVTASAPVKKQHLLLDWRRFPMRGLYLVVTEMPQFEMVFQLNCKLNPGDRIAKVLL
jgi:hypothetical protein